MRNMPLDAEHQPIDIGICTFRRDHIATTLRSLARLALPVGRRIRVIVADNDVNPSARALVTKVAQDNGLDLTYIHAPANNISVARNACLDAATAPLLAFIDDDETVAPSWLQALLDAMEHGRADVVFGPVRALYGADCPEWLRRGDYGTTQPVQTGHGILTGYAGNVLLRRSAPALQQLRFRHELGQTGGEDTLFFAAVSAAGGQLGYAPDAVAMEATAPERYSLAWLIKRRFRYGQTHGLLLLETTAQTPGLRVKAVLLAAAKMLYCFGAALASLLHQDRRIFWILRGAMHAGVTARLLGQAPLQLYSRK